MLRDNVTISEMSLEYTKYKQLWEVIFMVLLTDRYLAMITGQTTDVQLYCNCLFIGPQMHLD